MTFSLIYASDIHGCIGKNNTIPWQSRVDMERFKMLTVGKVCLMGRKTFESLPKPLSNRHNVVVSTDINWLQNQQIYDNVSYYGSLASGRMESIDLVNNYGWSEEIMVIGGAQVYKQMLPFATKVYRTTFDTEVQDGDTFFKFQPNEEEGWKQIYNTTCNSEAWMKHWFTIHQRNHSK